MKYDTLLFDIDNTLLDFTADENQALDRLFSLTPIKLTSRIKKQYIQYNQNLWDQLEKGRI